MSGIKSTNGKIIRLPDERWMHIVEGHPEMAGHVDDVLSTVALPDIVVQGSAGELLAVRYESSEKVLVVIYKENETDGFILTAYFTTQVNKILKKTILWQR